MASPKQPEALGALGALRALRALGALRELRALRALLPLLLFLVGVGAFAQEVRPEWAVDFSSIFDNREGDSRYTDAKTFFQTQLAPEVGLSFLGGTARVMGGVVWTQPIGEEWDDYHLSPTLYFRYDNRGPWAFSMGMFPRHQLTEPLPNYIWNDSVQYCQHNIRGAMVQYRGANGWGEAVVDWRGMQTSTQREAFNIIVQGRYQRPRSWFFWGGVGMLNHFALVKDAPADQHIVDNILLNPYVGVDLGSRVGLDSLTLKAGPLMGIVRNREISRWKAPAGIWFEGYARWRFLGLRQQLYAGGRLFPYYQQFGAALDQGEPYFQSKYFSRTDVYAYILSNKYMDLRASLDFNVAEHNFNFYQRLILRVYLSSDKPKRPHLSNFL